MKANFTLISLRFVLDLGEFPSLAMKIFNLFIEILSTNSGVKILFFVLEFDELWCKNSNFHPRILRMSSSLIPRDLDDPRYHYKQLEGRFGKYTAAMTAISGHLYRSRHVAGIETSWPSRDDLASRTGSSWMIKRRAKRRQ